MILVWLLDRLVTVRITNARRTTSHIHFGMEPAIVHAEDIAIGSASKPAIRLALFYKDEISGNES